MNVAISDIVEISDHVTRRIIEVSDKEAFVKSIITNEQINAKVKSIVIKN